MPEPFRNEMGAALSRLETLEDENADLREQVERLRSAALAAGTGAANADLADQATRVLEQLDALSQRRPAAASAPEPPSKAPRDRLSAERADLNVIAAPALRPPVVRTEPTPPERNFGVVLSLCFVSFIAGMIVNALVFR